ncbi:hypothetical protein Dimus_017558 [Dionaea muscipula]
MHQMLPRRHPTSKTRNRFFGHLLPRCSPQPKPTAAKANRSQQSDQHHLQPQPPLPTHRPLITGAPHYLAHLPLPCRHGQPPCSPPVDLVPRSRCRRWRSHDGGGLRWGVVIGGPGGVGGEASVAAIDPDLWQGGGGHRRWAAVMAGQGKFGGGGGYGKLKIEQQRQVEEEDDTH